MPKLAKWAPRSRANATPEKKIVTQQEWDPETGGLKYTYGGPDTEKRAKEGEGRPAWTDPSKSVEDAVKDVIPDSGVAFCHKIRLQVETFH